MDCMNCAFGGYGTQTCNNECGKYDNYRETRTETQTYTYEEQREISYDRLMALYKEMEEIMLDERRQKNNINKLYQKMKRDYEPVETLKKELEVANNASVFDKTRCNNLIKRLNAAETIIDMKSDKTVDKEELKKILNWIKVGGNL